MTKKEEQLLDRLIDFVHGIGLKTQECTFTHQSLLPGFDFGHQCIIIDREKVKYPGDLLHEAGHLAVVWAEKREKVNSLVENPVELTDGEEIAAILWSYAALLELNLDPKVVFHEYGYKGDGEWIIEQIEQGNYIGLPFLEWRGMAYGHERAMEEETVAFPKMHKWLCGNEPE